MKVYVIRGDYYGYVGVAKTVKSAINYLLKCGYIDEDYIVYNSDEEFEQTVLQCWGARIGKKKF